MRRGPPPAQVTTAIVIGTRPDTELAATFGKCPLTTRLESPDGVDNEEDEAAVQVCSGLVRPWSEAWPHLRRLGGRAASSHRPTVDGLSR